MPPADRVAVCHERINQENVRLVFSYQFARVIETVCAAANATALVVPKNCRHLLFTDTHVAHHYDAALVCAGAGWRAIFHGWASFNKLVRVSGVQTSRIGEGHFHLFIFYG